MRDLEQRIFDAQDTPARIADREKRYEQKRCAGKFLAFLASYAHDTTYIRLEERKFEASLVLTPWEKVIHSIDMFDDSQDRYSVKTRVVEVPSELHEDVSNFAAKLSEGGQVPDRLTVGIGYSNGMGGQRITIEFGGVDEESNKRYIFSSKEFMEFDLIEQALIGALPGVINEVATTEAALSAATSEHAIPLHPFIR